MIIHNDDQALIEAGYKPQLKRSLGFFSSFAMPFSEISITTGIFANFGFVLTKAGPFGFWTWPIIAFGHTMVALVFAEMAGRIPLAGSVYNWNNTLANPTIGWLTGWLAMISFAIGTAVVTTTMLPVIAVITGYEFGRHAASGIAVALIILQLTINLYGVSLTSHINIVAVIAEIVSMLGLGLLITFMVASKGHFHFDFLTTVPAQPRPYWPGFLVASLLGAWTMIGFECSADVSEETVDARNVTPRGILSAILISASIGFAFIVTMTIAIPDLAEVSKASYPLAAIITHYLGSAGTNLFLAFVLTSMFACAMVVMMAGARLLFAMARDGRIIAAPVFQKVSVHHVPKNATFLISALAIVFVLLRNNLPLLADASIICVILYYLITVISFAIAAPKLPKTKTFSLGRWHWPVIIVAVMWLIIEMAILTVPDEFHPAAVTASGVVAAGVIVYLGLLQKTKYKAR
jgi:amino acid transporter